MKPTKFCRAAWCGAMLLLPFMSASADTLTVQRVDGWIGGLSADGRAAVGQTSDDFQTFRWTAHGGVQLLGRGTWGPLGARSGLPAISADGQTIASTILADAGTYGTMGRWTVQGGWQQIVPPLPADGGILDFEDASVFGMSRDGKVITGLYWRPGQSDGSAHGARWSAATNLTSLGSDGNSSRADDANADGSVLVGWDEHPTWGNRRAAVWVNGVKTVLDNSDWPSEASAVNAAGTIVVGSAVDDSQTKVAAVMWKWDGQQWVRTVLGTIDKRRKIGTAFANGVSDDGSIVVGIARPDQWAPDSVGFVWTAAGGMQDVADYLKAAGVAVSPLLTLDNVTAITGDGAVMAVTGYVTRPAYAGRSLIVRRRATP